MPVATTWVQYGFASSIESPGTIPITVPPASAAPRRGGLHHAAAAAADDGHARLGQPPPDLLGEPPGSTPRASAGADHRDLTPRSRLSLAHLPPSAHRAAESFIVRISSSAPCLVQRLVEVAALGALHAGGAAGLAGALGDQPLGVAEQALELLVAAQGDPDPARMAVVDEDRRAAGLEVDVGREAADVPAVAHRDQRQHRDLAVLGRVQGAEQDVGRQRPAEPLRQHVPERLGDEVLLGQLQGDDVDGLLVGDRDALEGDHLLGHRDLAEVQLDARRPARCSRTRSM